MLFGFFLTSVAVLSGAIAAVTGFGVGSLLTPVLALETGTKLAVAAIAVPHFIGTAQRFWMLRRHVDRRVLLGFGIASGLGVSLGLCCTPGFRAGRLQRYLAFCCSSPALPNFRVGCNASDGIAERRG